MSDPITIETLNELYRYIDEHPPEVVENGFHFSPPIQASAAVEQHMKTSAFGLTVLLKAQRRFLDRLR